MTYYATLLTLEMGPVPESRDFNQLVAKGIYSIIPPSQSQIHLGPDKHLPQSHASPQSSSAAPSFGFVSITLDTDLCATGFPVTTLFLAAAGDFPCATGTLPIPLADLLLLKPFGNGALLFACFCALSHPAKSGSPPSSNGVGLVTVDCVLGASKNETSSPPRSPHASSISSSSAWAEVKNWSVDVRVRTGAEGGLKTWRCNVLAEDFDVTGFEEMDGVGGTEEDRFSVVGVGKPFDLGCISPLAAAILLVKDEMAQPVQDVSF